MNQPLQAADVNKRLHSGIDIQFPICFFLKNTFSGETKDYRNPFARVKMMSSDSKAVKDQHLDREPVKTPVPKIPRTASEEDLMKKARANLSVSSISGLFLFHLRNPKITYLVQEVSTSDSNEPSPVTSRRPKNLAQKKLSRTPIEPADSSSPDESPDDDPNMIIVGRLEQRISRLESKVNVLDLYRLRCEKIRTASAFNRRNKRYDDRDDQNDFKRPRSSTKSITPNPSFH